MITNISNLFLTMFIKQFQITHISSFKRHGNQRTHKHKLRAIKIANTLKKSRTLVHFKANENSSQSTKRPRATPSRSNQGHRTSCKGDTLGALGLHIIHSVEMILKLDLKLI